MQTLRSIQAKDFRIKFFFIFAFLLCYFSAPLAAEIESTVQSVANAHHSNAKMFDKSDFLTLQNQLRIIGFVTVLSLIPFGVMLMTSFTRISIILQFLRQALSSSQVPSNQILIGLSLILTGFIMHPVIKEIQHQAINPYMKGQFKSNEGVRAGAETEEGLLLEKAWVPLRNFLLEHTRDKDLELFLDIGQIHLSENSEGNLAVNSIPWYCLVPSFILSELRTAFMMGFLLFLPFLIIDMVVAAILMSMGMMMLPPVMVSTPFKLLLFILIDGWRLIIQQIVSGYHPVG